MASPVDPDACPNCGELVKGGGGSSTGSGFPMAEPDQQRADCPKCGSLLRRTIGKSWLISARQWRVVLQGTPHDLITSALADAGVLTRSTSATLLQEGTAGPRYEAEVQADTSDEAREKVSRVVAAHDTTIESVEPA